MVLNVNSKPQSTTMPYFLRKYKDQTKSATLTTSNRHYSYSSSSSSSSSWSSSSTT
ncbi:hypothetical protein BpHYR1_021921, partial [Brachionus plicatilis]